MSTANKGSRAVESILTGGLCILRGGLWTSEGLVRSDDGGAVKLRISG